MSSQTDLCSTTVLQNGKEQKLTLRQHSITLSYAQEERVIPMSEVVTIKERVQNIEASQFKFQVSIFFIKRRKTVIHQYDPNHWLLGALELKMKSKEEVDKWIEQVSSIIIKGLVRSFLLFLFLFYQ
jgi:hypothetical protein